MYRDEYQEDYRAGYNPEFLKAVMIKRREQEAAERAELRRAQAAAQAEAQRQAAAERARIRQERQATLDAINEHQAAIDTLLKSLEAQPVASSHTYREIERRACKVFGISRQDITKNRRHKDLVFARQFIMYWAARLTRLSYPQIGQMMGGKDHTTCLHGARAYIEKRARMGRHLPSKASFYARQHTDRET